MTSRTGSARRIWGIFELSWELDSERQGSIFGARWRQTNLCATGAVRVAWGVGRWKDQNRKNMNLSPGVGETLNSKLIKSFIPEVFFVFRDFMFYVYMLWTLYVRFTYPYHEYGTPVDTKIRLLLYIYIYVYPTPTHERQGWFLKVWFQNFPSPKVVSIRRLKNPFCPTIHGQTHTFPKSITSMWNTNPLYNLNSGHSVHFLRQ